MRPLMTLALGAAGYWLYKSGRLQPQIDRYRPQIDSMLEELGLRTPSAPQHSRPDFVGASTDRESQSAEMRGWPATVAAAPSYAGDHERQDIKTDRPKSETAIPKSKDTTEDLREWPSEPVAGSKSSEHSNAKSTPKADS